MKQLFVILLIFAAFSFNATAQTTKAIAKQQTAVSANAEKVAFANADIIKRVDEKTGAVSFVRKEVCEKSGNVSYKAVIFNEETGTFVDAPEKAAKVKTKAKRKSTSCSRRSCNRPGKSCGSKKKSCSHKNG